MPPQDDAEAEEAAERVLVRFRELVSRLPLRAAFVEALGIEARPAVHALLFALATDRAEDASSLEHHETTAMIALLGRSFALDGSTPTAASGVVPALLAAFREEGFEVPSRLDGPLALVFLEGYVRGREERIRGEAAQRALEAVVLVPIAPRVGLIGVRGAHDAELLGSRLEALVREAFAQELVACVIDASGSAEQLEDLAGPVLHAAELLRSIGVRIVFAGPSGVAWASLASADASPNVGQALERAFQHAGLVLREEGALVRPLRALFGARPKR